jgi:hypothetical protein
MPLPFVRLSINKHVLCRTSGMDWLLDPQVAHTFSREFLIAPHVGPISFVVYLHFSKEY